MASFTINVDPIDPLVFRLTDSSLARVAIIV